MSGTPLSRLVLALLPALLPALLLVTGVARATPHAAVHHRMHVVLSPVSGEIRVADTIVFDCTAASSQASPRRLLLNRDLRIQSLRPASARVVDGSSAGPHGGSVQIVELPAQVCRLEIAYAGRAAPDLSPDSMGSGAMGDYAGPRGLVLGPDSLWYPRIMDGMLTAHVEMDSGTEAFPADLRADAPADAP
ncbi:MAG: hypothetical protein KDK91_12955, partial [Gammaproteobacteria bacterium]|nr:hypothetical protein [Gammaproteobacteria bacterium]